MDTKLVESAANEVTELPTRSDRRKLLWSVSAIGSFVGSGLCFISGLIASLASVLGLLPVSSVTARLTVGILLAAFLLAFVGAHAVDKIDQTLRDSPPTD